MLSFIYLILGFILLVRGADDFVAGASSLARKMGIPALIVGLTVVAFGTSAPELTVSITAGMKGANALAISNVLGSNLFNMLVVIGGCALFAPQVTDKSLLKRDWPFTITACALLFLMIVLDWTLSRLDGLLLLGLFFFVITTQIRAGLQDRNALHAEQEDVSEIKNPVMIGLRIVMGLVFIVLGGNLCVESATEIAYLFGLSETIVGLTVVSVGTSLPELVTSVVATRKGEREIAIGNVVGSNLFNVLLILSISSILTPIQVERNAIIDSLFVVMISCFLFYFASKNKINRGTGISMLLCYVIYMVYVVVRDVYAVPVSVLV